VAAHFTSVKSRDHGNPYFLRTKPPPGYSPPRGLSLSPRDTRPPPAISSRPLHGTQHRPWLTELLARRPTKVAAIALANKIARMAWAMMARVNATGNPPHVRREEDRAVHPACCEGWEGEQHVMQSRSIRRSGQPISASASIECGLMTGTRSAEGIMASGHANRANRPNTWLHRSATGCEVLTCQPEPSTHGS
jgi:hypothetical protein